MHFKSIQFLRGFAAVYIVMYHVIYSWHKTGSFLSHIFDYGYGAIDLFFVISGFVLFQSLTKFEKGIKPAFHFLVIRFSRIYLFYWIVLLAFFLLGIITFKDLPTPQILKTLLLFPSHVNVLVTSWTLPYELYFYVLMALYIVNKKFVYLLVPIFILSALSFISTVTNNYISSIPIYGYFNEFVLEFFLGIFATIIYKKISTPVSIIFLMLGVILFFLLPSLLLKSHVIMFGLPSFLTLTGMVQLESRSKISVHRSFVLLGDSSFIIYLIHGPLIAKALFFLEKNKYVNRSAILFIVIIIVIVSYIIHYFLEKPVLRMIKKSVQI